MKFTKMHGCGNDYIYVNCFKETIDKEEEAARILSDRHFGIGSDGLILIKPSKKADVRMVMYNADGSESEMCGNGIRCVAKYAYDYGIVDKTSLSVETRAGMKELLLQLKDGKVNMVTVDMGVPVTEPSKVPVITEKETFINEWITVNGMDYAVTGISMGNPHAVTFVEDTEAVVIEEIGPAFENHPLFPQRVNTEFVQVIDRNTINMRVWERGSGETLACGTGACASVYACILNGKTDHEVLVHLLGGDLKIRYEEASGHIFMTGPATQVYDGEIELQEIGRLKN